MQKALVIITTFICILQATKIADLASILGVRENQLIGYGLVVGLNGSGDGSSSEFTIQSISNMLQSMDVKVDVGSIKSKNAAAVIVTAKLPAFARQGDSLDVSISSIGDAKSLAGGTLLMTPLKGVDGEIYAIAQGALSIGGKSAGRGDANHPTAGNIPQGAIVEKEVAHDFSASAGIVLSLNKSDFDAAIKIQNTINQNIYQDMANAIDSKTIVVKSPFAQNLVELSAQILALEIDYSPQEKIIIDERTGTIISGINIEVAPVVLTHKDITIQIKTDSDAKEDDIKIGDDTFIEMEGASIKVPQKKASISSLTRALSKLGATPSDIIAIIQNLKRVGAISAPVEVI